MLSFLCLYITLISLCTAMVNAGRGGSFIKGLGVGIPVAVLSALALWGLLHLFVQSVTV